ncbi:unnamed protein product [Blepharisma stoltei]|uniref:Uncharacterized protein n=1 Tax=Blepharisma stoltei TaxID=1481888 RepID=A0AAU9J2G5_9CILI|nr:unnamed protein product [Blepharisma stoltei]
MEVSGFNSNQLLTPSNLRAKISTIFNSTNCPELEQDFRKTCVLFESQNYASNSQLSQAYQDYINAYHKVTSLYIINKNDKSSLNLIVYDTENDTEEVKELETPQTYSIGICIAQLPNCELFCFGKGLGNGNTFIIDKNFGVRMLPSGENIN